MRRRTAATTRTANLPSPSMAPWSRTKLIALFAGGALTAVLVVVGLVLAVVQGTTSSSSKKASPLAAGSVPAGSLGAETAAPIDPQAGADELALHPMATVPISASHPLPISLADPGKPILLPRSTRTGPAGVPTGFPHTPEGALAQLAAIDSTALNAASVPAAREVIAVWALPGGPTTSSWSGVAAIAQLLDSAGVSGGTGQLAVVTTPLMGLIKGTVGTDFVIPCVDFEVDVTLNTTARGAIADCQRMVWSAGRWMIGPGAEPADAPSVWPSSDLAYQVGYKDLRRG